MILPIYAYGQSVLKQKAALIPEDYKDLEQLVANMWETMYNAQGVGLAGPQVGLSLRIFVVDTIQVMEEGKEAEGIKQVFINAEVVEEGGTPYDYEEGCLSIPNVRGDVERPAQVKIRYQDEEFQEHTTLFTGINARVIQHEYDHIEGILFTQKLKPLKRRLVRRKLDKIRKGQVKADYQLKF